MINASSCTVESWMHLGDIAKLTRTPGILIDVIKVLNLNM